MECYARERSAKLRKEQGDLKREREYYKNKSDERSVEDKKEPEIMSLNFLKKSRSAIQKRPYALDKNNNDRPRQKAKYDF